MITPYSSSSFFLFFFNDTATTEIYTLSLHDALPIFAGLSPGPRCLLGGGLEGPELLAEGLDDSLGVADQAFVRGHAKHHAARVAEDADAKSKPARLGNPEHHIVQLSPGEVEGLARAGDVGEHGRGLAAEEAQAELFHLDRRQAHEVEDAIGDQGFGGALELVHLLLDRVQAADGIDGADGQGEKHEPERVAELVRLVEWAEVDRDRSTDGDACRGLAATVEVAPQRAGSRGDEHVVDRRPEGLADRLEVVEGHRARPRGAFAPAELALEGGLWIGWQRDQ